MTRLSSLPGVGPKTLGKLESAGIKSVKDLIENFPFRYEDYSNVKKPEDVVDREEVSITGTLASKGQFRSRNGRLVVSLRFKHEKKSFGAIWFNQQYITKMVEVGKSYILSGKVKVVGKQVSMFAPKIQEFGGESLGIVPIYHQSGDVKSSLLWRLNKNILKDLKSPDFLPDQLIKQAKLVSLYDALKKIHQPKKVKDYEVARKRLAVNELLGIYLKAELNGAVWRRKPGYPVSIDLEVVSKMLSSLPFKLTLSQHESILSIWKEMKNDYPMNKLLVGDVGSGKTIVAALACGIAAKSGYKSIVLCPTLVLADQHYRTINEYLKKFGIKVGMVTSQKKLDGDVLIGTHALLGQSHFESQDNVGLVVIDEEQRFGVMQRSQYLKKTRWPHMLSLTATPIPRTIAMMNMGHVSYSYLSQKPKGRKVVKTYVVGNHKRSKMLEFCTKRVLEHDERVFYVCPVIEADNKGKKVVDVYKELADYWKGTLKVGVLHGKTPESEKISTMNDFRSGKIKVLVATTVIEVGVDIPRATVMIVDSGEQFGLAQLHQLRGRVGRDGSQGYCFLLCDDEEGKLRLAVMTRQSDGLEIAKQDLAIRGPGEVFGLSQSGRLNTSFKEFWDDDVNNIAKNMAQIVALDEPRAVQILETINPSLANFDLPN